MNIQNKKKCENSNQTLSILKSITIKNFYIGIEYYFFLFFGIPIFTIALSIMFDDLNAVFYSSVIFTLLLLFMLPTISFYQIPNKIIIYKDKVQFHRYFFGIEEFSYSSFINVEPSGISPKKVSCYIVSINHKAETYSYHIPTVERQYLLNTNNGVILKLLLRNEIDFKEIPEDLTNYEAIVKYEESKEEMRKYLLSLLPFYNLARRFTILFSIVPIVLFYSSDFKILYILLSYIFLTALFIIMSIYRKYIVCELGSFNCNLDD